MELDKAQIVKLLFPAGLPEYLRGKSELKAYLSKLSTYNIDELKAEYTRLQDQAKLVEQKQALTVAQNQQRTYTIKVPRLLTDEFDGATKRVTNIVLKMPSYNARVELFVDEADALNEERHLQSFKLRGDGPLVDVGELPNVMSRCIEAELFEEAIELGEFVHNLSHRNYSVAVNVMRATQAQWALLSNKLVGKFRQDVKMPRVLELVGYLRRMQAFTNHELKAKFLLARNSWLNRTLEMVPQDNAQKHLLRTMSMTRKNLFIIVRQFRAIFFDELSFPYNKNPLNGVDLENESILQAWLHRKVHKFMQTLEDDLDLGINSFDIVLRHCMHFGMAFNRVGVDLRSIVVPIFERVIIGHLDESFKNLSTHVDKELFTYAFASKSKARRMRKEQALVKLPKLAIVSTGRPETLVPPRELLEFPPLSSLCVGFVHAFNELRQCAPYGLANVVTVRVQKLLLDFSERIIFYYNQKQRHMHPGQHESYIRMVLCYVNELVPFMQECITEAFPAVLLVSQFKMSADRIEREGITRMSVKEITAPIKDLMVFKKGRVSLRLNMRMQMKESSDESSGERKMRARKKKPKLERRA